MKSRQEKNHYARKWYQAHYQRTKNHLNLLRRNRYQIDESFRKKTLFCNAARRYGISLSLYKELVTIHKNQCSICGQQCKSGRSLAVDHDHNSGRTRGLLCSKCNSGIGQFDDNPERLRAAANYLERYYLPQSKE